MFNPGKKLLGRDWVLVEHYLRGQNDRFEIALLQIINQPDDRQTCGSIRVFKHSSKRTCIDCEKIDVDTLEGPLKPGEQLSCVRISDQKYSRASSWRG